MSFKIIGLEVLAGCASEHSKNLIKNFPYHFYNNYKIDTEKNQIQIKDHDIDLYSYNSSNLKINISAIVGKNGSGKSTMIELLIKAINNLFYTYKEDNKSTGRKFHDVEKVANFEVNIFYFKSETMYRLHVKNSSYNIYRYEEGKDKKSYLNPAKLESEFNLTDFFYTEVINYSLYAYNSSQEGSWITEIFHKNDSYQTPVVLNPFRKKGNIDIQTENSLVFQRLLANLVRYDKKGNLTLRIGDNLEVENITLQLSNSIHYGKKLKKDTGVTLSLVEKNSDDDVLKSLLLIIYNQTIPRVNVKILRIVRVYVLYKLINICHKYEEYSVKNFFDFKDQKFKNLESLIRKLKKDNSHITFKLRQTLNYLLLQHVPFDINNDKNKIHIKDLAESIKVLKVKNIIEYLPPPIFKVDLELSAKSQKDIKFSTLSSGEKQQIYSVNSIFYHLINLDSVKNSTDSKKLYYENVNIILEEIELYFHPEFQKNYIKLLIDGIFRLNLKNIKALNFIFVTHSPFILSDLPSSNILYLIVNQDGKAEEYQLLKAKSFAANIHHLLGDNFFFGNNIYIGAFAQDKVKELIDYINNTKEKNIQRKHNDILHYYNIIQLIDEPILKNKLLEMFNEISQFKSYLGSRHINIEEELIKDYAKRYNRKINFE